MTVCKFRREDGCRYDDDQCWYNHHEEASESESPPRWTSTTPSSRLSQQSNSAPLAIDLSSPSRLKSPSPTLETSSPEHLDVQTEMRLRGETFVTCTSEAGLQLKITELEAEVRSLKGLIDPDRQALKDVLLKEKLDRLREQNLDLQVEAKTAESWGSNLRAEMGILQERYRAIEEPHRLLETEVHQLRLDKQALEQILEGLKANSSRRKERLAKHAPALRYALDYLMLDLEGKATNVPTATQVSRAETAYAKEDNSEGFEQSPIMPASGSNILSGEGKPFSFLNGPPPQDININAMPKSGLSASYSGFSPKVTQPISSDPNDFASLPGSGSTLAPFGACSEVPFSNLQQPSLFGKPSPPRYGLQTTPSSGKTHTSGFSCPETTESQDPSTPGKTSSIHPFGRYGGLFGEAKSSEEVKTQPYEQETHTGPTPRSSIFNKPPKGDNSSPPILVPSQQDLKRKREDVLETTRSPAPYALNSSSLSIEQKFHVQEYGEGVGELKGRMPRRTGITNGHGGLQSTTATTAEEEKAGPSKGKNVPSFMKATVEDFDDEPSGTKKSKKV